MCVPRGSLAEHAVWRRTSHTNFPMIEPEIVRITSTDLKTGLPRRCSIADRIWSSWRLGSGCRNRSCVLRLVSLDVLICPPNSAGADEPLIHLPPRNAELLLTAANAGKVLMCLRLGGPRGCIGWILEGGSYRQLATVSRVHVGMHAPLGGGGSWRRSWSIYQRLLRDGDLQRSGKRKAWQTWKTKAYEVRGALAGAVDLTPHDGGREEHG